MDFAQRSSTPSNTPAPNRPVGVKKSNKKLTTTILRWSSFVLLISVAIVAVATLASVIVNKTHDQSKYVDTKQYQAVFLNGGQVYFGKITSLNSRYLALSHIYYLRVNQAVQPNNTSSNSNDVSLVKLGCELHGPQDQMVINEDQVVFWENLKGDGQVAKAVAEYQRQNPNGQNCATANSTTNSSSSTSTKK